jgi:phosphoribosylformylglycinamidine synthase
VVLAPNKNAKSPWLHNLENIYCPVAHGEGRFLLSENETFPQEQIGLTYTHIDGRSADGEYPINPNGSIQDIAGIINSAGNVLGLMPHPEDHIYKYQHPNWTRGKSGGMGVKLFKNGLMMA